MNTHTEPPRDAEAYIKANVPPAPVPTAPEIRLRLAGPTSGLRRLAEMEGDGAAPPYWAYVWGGGVGLARHILDHPHLVAGRSVLDLGAGSGLVGIAAAKAGAERVIAVDIDRYAVAATRLNAAENGVEILAVQADLTAGAPPDVDVVLVGDLFYDADLAARVTAFLDRCRARGMDVLVGDPGRVHLPRTRLRLIAAYAGPDFGAPSGARSRNAVFAMRPDRGKGSETSPAAHISEPSAPAP